jgi:hypothetical protein
MDRLIETVAECLCRHKSVGLLRLTLDLTRRRPELFAEIGAAEVVKGAVAPPTPGTETWRVAVREAVYALRQRGLVQYIKERPRWSTGRARPADIQTPQNRQLRRTAFFPAFFLVFAFARRRRMAPRFHPTPCEMNVKRWSKPTAEPTKNQRKT